MIKKLSAVFFLLLILLSFCSCNSDREKEKGNLKNNISVTEKSTAVYNHFKDRIPEYNFDNDPVEKYEDGLSYSLSVKCSEREYKSYLKKLKKAGFEINPVEADTYYNAADDEGYFVEVTYSNEMLIVYIGRS